jgi:hypothetical protein
MTCREFKRTAASLTLRELSRSRDSQILEHADECLKCGAWMGRQGMLAATMQTLQARTVGREAGPHVERALLRMFRQDPFEATQPVTALRSAPIAWRLSRLFEVGAYVAVAAAILVGVFLGVRLLEQRSGTGPVQSQSAPAAPTQLTRSAESIARQEAPAAMQERPVTSARRNPAAHPVSRSDKAEQSTSALVTQSSEDPEYVSLMFCDPLSCSSEAQVVRMELPAAGAATDHDAQPLVADVVVGYDGVVRAMRIVN